MEGNGTSGDPDSTPPLKYGKTDSDKMPMADPKQVAEGLEDLRAGYENFLNRCMERDGDVSFTTGLMLVHNFYKMVLRDIAEKSDMPEEAQQSFYAQAILRLSQALIQPKESYAHETEMRKKQEEGIDEDTENTSEALEEKP